MSESNKPHLLFFVAEDWSFLSHRMGIARAALRAGYRVSLMARESTGRAEIEAAGIEFYPFSMERAAINPLSELLVLWRVIQMYRRIKPDFVHQVAMKPVVYGSIAARLVEIRGRVNALIGLGFVFSSSTFLARLIRPFLKTMLRVSLAGERARLVLQNKDDVAFFVEEALVSQESIRLIRGSGVDPNQYAFVPENLEQVPLVVLPARLLKDKGIQEYVDAARILIKDRQLKVRMALVGKPDYGNPSSFTEEEIKLWVDDGLVECWGWRTDMVEVLRQANIACLPSYREGLPKALLEAASCGRAMVTTDVPGCRELVIKGENGWVVPVRDPVALADALQEAIENPDMRMRYIKESRARIESIFAETHIHQQTLDVYKEVLA